MKKPAKPISNEEVGQEASKLDWKEQFQQYREAILAPRDLIVGVYGWTRGKSQPPHHYASLPLSPGMFLAGFLLAAIFIYVSNKLIFWNMQADFQTQVPEALYGAQDADEACDRIVDADLADGSLKPWLLTFVRPDTRSADLIIYGLNSIASAGDSGSEEYERLQQLTSGDIRGSWLLPLCYARTVDADEIVEDLLARQEHWRDGLATASDGELKREFLAAVASDLNNSARPHVRQLRRLNGACQYLTIGLAATLVLAIVRRYLDIRAWSKSCRLPESTPVRIPTYQESLPHEVRRIDDILRCGQNEKFEDTDRLALYQEEVNQLNARVVEEVYDPLLNFNAFLPSLGFIGTVLGMGGALLLADQLFTASDRARAISQMTEQLGFAFDTTLVALVCSSLVMLMILWVRKKDVALRQRWFDLLEAAHLGRTTGVQSNVVP